MDEMYEEEASFETEFQDEFESPEEAVLAELDPKEKALWEKIQYKLKMTDPVLQAMKDMENAPSDEMIEDFKNRTGDQAYFITLSDKENFVFRPIRRQEWRTLMTNIAKLDEFKKSEAIVAKGVLHPVLSNINIGALSAGTVETLKEMILRASNFMTPEEAFRSVRKL